MVGDTGIEPVTPSVSGKCSPAELITRGVKLWTTCRPNWNREVGTGFEPVYTALQAVASPLGHPTEMELRCTSSGRRDSNPRPSPWQGDALPTALRPHRTSPCCWTSLSEPRGRTQIAWHAPG